MNKLEWLRSRGEANLGSINKLEQKLDVIFPVEYREIVLKHNGAVPSLKIFDIANRPGFIFQRLLNWDINRESNLMSMVDWIVKELPQNIVPFAEDPFGNFICFDFKGRDTVKIVFWNHEEKSITFVADSFVSFLAILHN